MAMEPGDEKSHANICRSEPLSLNQQRTAAQHYVEGGSKQRSTRSGVCRGITDNGSERAWRESGFFLLAML